MRSETSIILLEFNELCPSLMQRFISAGRLPHFARLQREAHVYTTDAGEQSPNLEPWIQWVTVHTGLSCREHGLFHLDEGHKLQRKRIWDVVSRTGRRILVCGSMNVGYEHPVNGCILPDPWSTTVAPYPPELWPYFRFVQANVLEHTSERVPLSWADHLVFLSFMARHGLSGPTVWSAIRQLWSERGGSNRWRRAVLLDQLQFDLFRWFYRRLRPSLCTFFLNSTAHFQHLYWRNMEPELFDRKPTADEQTEYGNAILFGYQEMDRLVGRCLALAAGGRAILILCTALSQQPCLKYEDIGGKSFYRPRDFEALLAFAGATMPHAVAPVMSEQFHVRFENEQDARQAEERLLALAVDGRPAMSLRRSGPDIVTGCGVFEQLPRTATLRAGDPRRSVPFFQLLYQVKGLKSGMHHPDGILWIRTLSREHVVHAEKVPLTTVAATILALLRLDSSDLGHTESLPLALRSA